MKSTNSMLTKQQQWSEQWTSLVIKVVLTVDQSGYQSGLNSGPLEIYCNCVFVCDE